MRPHIEFLQQQDLPWESGPYNDSHRRLLSQDAETGETTEMVWFPPDWELTDGDRADYDVELFVVGGDLAVAGHVLSRYHYARVPAAVTDRVWTSRVGALCVAFYNVPRQAADGAPRRDSVTVVDCLEQDNSGLRTPDFPEPAKRIDLFDDPDTGESSWILAGGSLRRGKKAEVHPVVEEMILLAGEMHSPNGVMMPGAYFWRPPHEWHGPFASIAGSVCLFRTRGGPLDTVYSDIETPLPWHPDYDPIARDASGAPVAIPAYGGFDPLEDWSIPS